MSSHWTTGQAARRLGVPRRTLQGWIRRGLVRVYRDRISGRFYVPEEEIERLLPERRLEPVGLPARPGRGAAGQ